MGQNPVETATVETALERVRRLADAVRRSHEAHRDTLTARDTAIRAAYRGGHHEADLAQAAGLTKQRIIDIVCLDTPTPAGA